MANRTLTINHADGGSEAYTINRDKFAGVRNMVVDGSPVSVDHTAVPKEQAKETTFGGSQSITVKRDIEPLLSKVVGGASAAYSLRDLNDVLGNTNKVARVRRSSDNAERDFTASEMGAALEDWVGAGNDGFVATWYDQSGNSNDATQSTAASQPKIVDAGTYLGELDFDGVDDTLSLTSGLTIDPSTSGFASFITAAFDKNATGSAQILLRNSSPNPKHIISFNTNGKYRYLLNDGTDALFADTASDYGDDSLRLFSTTITGQSVTGLTHFVDGAQDSQHDTSSIDDTGASVDKISWPSFEFGGVVKEIIIYNSDQSANRAAIEANINNHYDIY